MMIHKRLCVFCSVIQNGFWQGTLIYMEIGTNEEIDPNQIVDHRTDVTEEYNISLVSMWFQTLLPTNA